MKSKLAKSKLSDPDMRRVPKALYEAAMYAKKIAKQTGTKFVTEPLKTKK
jgi:hypothetical protein